MDAQVKQEASNLLSELFSNIGQQRQQPEGSLLGGLDIGQQLQEFATMPLELVQIFGTMGFELAELVLESLAKAGFTLVKGLTPA